MENYQISRVIMTRPKKTDLFAATTRQKKTLIAGRYATSTLHLRVLD